MNVDNQSQSNIKLLLKVAKPKLIEMEVANA